MCSLNLWELTFRLSLYVNIWSLYPSLPGTVLAAL
jgi:hypothetical protein